MIDRYVKRLQFDVSAWCEYTFKMNYMLEGGVIQKGVYVKKICFCYRPIKMQETKMKIMFCCCFF